MVVGTAGFGFRRGEVWGVHVEWSGDQLYAAERPARGRRRRAPGCSAAASCCGPARSRLAPGERYATPWVLFTWSDEGLDGGVGADPSLRAGAARATRADRGRSCSTPGRPSTSTTTSIGCGGSPRRPRRSASNGSCSTTAGSATAATTPPASATGTSTRTCGPTGSTRCSTSSASSAWRSGSGSSRRWSTSTPTSPAPIPTGCSGRPGACPLEWRHQQVLDVANPEVGDYLFDRLDALVAEYRLDFLKWDHNRDLSEAVSAGDRRRRVAPPDDARPTPCSTGCGPPTPAWRSNRARRAAPGSTSGILARTDRVWASDTVDAVERQPIQRWTSLLLPLELIGSHVGPPVAHTTGRAVGPRVPLPHGAVRPRRHRVGHHARRPRRSAAASPRGSSCTRSCARCCTAATSCAPTTSRRGCSSTASSPAIGSAALHAVVRLDERRRGVPGPFRLPGLDGPGATACGSAATSSSRPGGRPPAWWDAAAADGFTVSGAVLGRVGLQLPVLMPGQGFLLHGTAEHSGA